MLKHHDNIIIYSIVTRTCSEMMKVMTMMVMMMRSLMVMMNGDYGEGGAEGEVIDEGYESEGVDEWCDDDRDGDEGDGGDEYDDDQGDYEI